jgi:hypothetical protein
MVAVRDTRDDHSDQALRVRVLSRMVAASPHPGESGRTGVLNRLCRSVVADLAVTGAAVNVVAGPLRAQAVVGRSDEHSAAVDDLELVLGNGPRHDAARTGRAVHSSDLANEARWPQYCRAAQELDVGAVYAFPLQVGAVVLGVLDVHDSRSRVLDDGATALALAYADIATESLLQGNGADAGFIDPGLRTALGSHAQIYQAQGMIQVDHDVPLLEAMVRLRAFAYGHRRAITDVAREIVEGDLVLPSSTEA